MPVLIDKIVRAFYSMADGRKVRAWRMNREEATDLFYAENLFVRRYPALPQTKEAIKKMLEAGEGRILALPVVVDDEPGVRMEIEI